jgi:hypothetical protein
MSTSDPGTQRTELAIGDATLAFQPAEVRDLIATFVTGQASRAG